MNPDRFGLCGINNFPNVDPHRGIYQLQLIDQRDIHTAKDVLSSSLAASATPTGGRPGTTVLIARL